MAGGHKINPLILRTPATATSNRPGADVWRRTDGGSRRRRRTAHVALLLESRRPPHISLDSEAVLPGMDQLSPCPLSCLPPSQLPFHLPRRCQTTLDMRSLGQPRRPSTSTHASISGSVCSDPRLPTVRNWLRKLQWPGGTVDAVSADFPTHPPSLPPNCCFAFIFLMMGFELFVQMWVRHWG